MVCPRDTPFKGEAIAAHDSIRRLVEHVIALRDDAIAALGIQDAALCHVWMSNGGAQQNPPAGLDTLPARIQKWLALCQAGPRPSEGRRTQTLLRELIERLEDDQLDKMSGDELDLLETVYSFAHAVHDSDIFVRTRRVIAPRRARIAARRAGMPPVIGAPALSARLMVVRPEDILAAKPREVRRFAGVDLPSRGPVMVHSGHVRVLGDVPEGTSLVVEEGGCVVDGFVLGRIAVSGDCEVIENVSGVIISRNGDIRARNLVDGAFVVAKRGSVHCRRSHGAKLVFAGNAIRVNERTTGGRFLAPSVRVVGCIEAGEFHVSQRVAAGSFRSAPDATLDLVFRRTLSCKDYGEDPGKSMIDDVARALRCRAELSCAQQQMRVSIQEAENAAETALTYILAGDSAGEFATEVLSAQRRLDVLNRVLVGLRALYAEAEANLDVGDAAHATDRPASVDALYERLDAEISEMVDEGSSDTSLRTPYEEFKDSRKRVSMRTSPRQMHAALSDIGDKLRRWRREFLDLEETIHNGRENIRKSLQAVELFEDGVGSRSRVLTFQRLSRRVSENAPDDRLRRRVESPFVVMMARTTDARLSQAKKHKEQAMRLQQIFVQIHDTVWKQYQMNIDAEDSAAHRITVEGRFETSARLWADPAYLTMPPAEIPRGGTRVAVPSRGQPIRYVCVGNSILDEPIEVPAAEVLVGAR